MPSVSVSGSVSSSSLIASPKPHALDWLTGAIRDVEAEARALAKADIREVDTDVPVYASALLSRLTKIEELRGLMLHYSFPVWGLDNLERFSVVASAANATKPGRRKANPANRALLATSTRYLGTCRMEISILISRGWVEASVLEGLPTRTSFRNNSVCLMRCALILEEHLEQLAALQSKVTQEDIAEYIAVAERLSRLGAQRQLREGEPEDDMPARTFTLLDMAVDEVRAVLTFLFRKTPEKLDLYLPKKPKKRSNTKTTKAKKAKAPTNKKQASEQVDRAAE
jgi:hypothetical protein